MPFRDHALVKFLHRTRESLTRLLTEPQSELGRWQRSLRFLVELARHCAGELRHDRAGQMAASLTYHTLFSLLPVTALALVALNAFVGPEERERLKETAVEAVVQVLRGEEAPAGIATPREEEFEAVRFRLDEQFQAVLTELEGISFGSIGLIGVILFIWAATGLLATIEGSFNQILGGSSRRPWYLRLPLYYTAITLGPIVVLAGLLAQRRLLEIVETGEWTDWLAGPAVVMAPVVTTWVVLYLMYVLLPTSTVEKRAAVAGSLVSAVLFVATRELFQVYVSQAVARTLYGALALIPLTLLLIWLSWLIVLFGLELSYTLHSMRGRRFKREKYKRLEGRLFDPALSVPLVTRIAHGFAQGHVVTANSLSREFKLPPLVVSELLQRLEAARIVRRTDEGESGKKDPGYVPGRSPEKIAIAEVLNTVFALKDLAPGVERSGSAWHWVGETRKSAMEQAKATTVADLLPESGTDGAAEGAEGQK